MRALPALLCVATALSGCDGTGGAAPLPLVASVAVSAPSSTLAYGASMQLTATGLDAAGHPIDGVTEFTFTSGNPASIAVSKSGLATAIFSLVRPPATTITATLTRDGQTFRGTVEISPSSPETFDHAALLLSEYELPERVPTLGQGIAYFAVDSAGVHYTVAWSSLSGAATAASLRGPADAAGIAPVLVDLPPGIQALGHGSVIGSFTAADIHPDGMSLDDLLSLMDRMEAYVEVSTAAFPAGEIRGQVVATSR